MPFDPALQATADIDTASLSSLVQRTCQALQAMASSLEALNQVLLRLRRLGPPAGPPTALMTGTRATVSRVVALLRREGPPLLFRVQALRLRLRANGHGAGNSGTVAMRRLHADLDALAAFQLDDAVHWDGFIRRLRANTEILLAEFDSQRLRLGPCPTPPAMKAPPAITASA